MKAQKNSSLKTICSVFLLLLITLSYGQETINVYENTIVCENNPIEYKAKINKVGYLDFKKANSNFANLNTLETNLTGQDRSFFK